MASSLQGNDAESQNASSRAAPESPDQTSHGDVKSDAGDANNGAEAGAHGEDENEAYGDGDGYDDDEGKGDGAHRERRKIEIKFILNKARRHITFSKRKHGIMKKAWELSVLTGTQVLLLVVSETGLVYTFTTPKLQPLVTQSEGKNLIQACLNAPENPSDGNAESADEDSSHAEEQLVVAAASADASRNGPGGPLPPPAGLDAARRRDAAPGSNQTPPSASDNIGNLIDPTSNPAYANVLAARKAEEANQQRLAQLQYQQQHMQRQNMMAQQQLQHLPAQQGGAGAFGSSGSAASGDAASSQAGAQNTAAAAALQAQALHMQQMASQGYKPAPLQFGYGGYPFPVGALNGQFPGQMGAPLDANTLLALQQQQGVVQPPQSAQPAQPREEFQQRRGSQ